MLLFGVVSADRGGGGVGRLNGNNSNSVPLTLPFELQCTCSTQDTQR